MDRFVIREPRANTDYPQGNQLIAFTTNAGSSNMVPPESMLYPGNYGAELANGQRMVASPYIPINCIGYTPSSYQQTYPGPSQAQGPIVSGIDPRYLVGYTDSAQYIASGQQVQGIPGNAQSIVGNVQASTSFGSDYQNRNFSGPARSKPQTFTPQVVPSFDARNQQDAPKNKEDNYKASNQSAIREFQSNNEGQNIKRKEPGEAATNQTQNPVLTRADKIKALYKSGPRVFSGPVENVLKWHKALQDIGILIIYEVVAKCVSIRPGESGVKNLVVRDDNGPAMQVVYYEIDFLLPTLKPPCTVRVIGRMMAGTSRLQAFNVRIATGDDVMMLPRRAAIAAHHVAKLCKEYGNNA